MEDVETPSTPATTRRIVSALGLGFGIAGVGATLGELYRKPHIAIGGMLVGITAALIHLPWSTWMTKEPHDGAR